MNSVKPCLLLGAGGHAKVVAECANLLGFDLIAIAAPEQQSSSFWSGVTYLSCDDQVLDYQPQEVVLLNGIGQVPNTNMRRQVVFERFKTLGYRFATLVHPSAWVSSSSRLEEGAQIFAGAIVQSDTHIGANTIVNTRALVEHDCQVGSHCHLAPGAILCGQVTLGDRVFVGAGAIVIQDLSVAPEAIIGAGVTVIRSVETAQTLVTKG